MHMCNIYSQGQRVCDSLFLEALLYPHCVHGMPGLDWWKFKKPTHTLGQFGYKIFCPNPTPSVLEPTNKRRTAKG